MTDRAKNIIYSLLLITVVFIVWKYRQSNSNAPIKLEGKTMGTSYNIIYFDKQNRNFKVSIDSILLLVNKSISTWDSTSEISQFNRAMRSIKFKLPYFLSPLMKAREVVMASQGAFDPTVMPLVNAWGFGPKKVEKPDTAEVERVKAFVGFKKLNFDEDSLWKMDSRVQLDFSGIGQGYGADVVTDFLKSKNIENALVEIGGEGMAIGKNIFNGEFWRLGIVDPLQPASFKGYVNLQNKSFSTSGNYFNYREVNGRRYSHTLDPYTGYPTERAILSASVFSNDCTSADAWATAIMCMGHERAIELLKSQPGIGVCLFYSTDSGEVGTYVSENMKPFISFEQPK